MYELYHGLLHLFQRKHYGDLDNFDSMLYTDCKETKSWLGIYKYLIILSQA